MNKKNIIFVLPLLFSLFSCENSDNHNDDPTGDDKDYKVINISENDFLNTINKNNKDIDLVNAFNLQKYDNDSSKKTAKAHKNYQSTNDEDETFVVTEDYAADYNSLAMVKDFESYFNAFIHEVSEIVTSNVEKLSEQNRFGSFVLNDSNKQYVYATFDQEKTQEFIEYNESIAGYDNLTYYYLMSNDSIELYVESPNQFVKEGYVDADVAETFFDRYYSMKYEDNQLKEITGTIYRYQYNSYLKEYVTIRRENDVVTYVDYVIFCSKPGFKGEMDTLTIVTYKDDLCFSTTFDHIPGISYGTNLFADNSRDFSGIEICQAEGGSALYIYPGRGRLIVPASFIHNYQSMVFTPNWYNSKYHIPFLGEFAYGMNINDVFYDNSETMENFDNLEYYTFYPVSHVTTIIDNNYYPACLGLAEFYAENLPELTFQEIIDIALDKYEIEMEVYDALAQFLDSFCVGDTQDIEKINKISSAREIEKWANNPLHENVNAAFQISEVLELTVEEICK